MNVAAGRQTYKLPCSGPLPVAALHTPTDCRPPIQPDSRDDYGNTPRAVPGCGTAVPRPQPGRAVPRLAIGHPLPARLG